MKQRTYYKNLPCVAQKRYVSSASYMLHTLCWESQRRCIATRNVVVFGPVRQ